MKPAIFARPDWHLCKYDARRREFRNISRPAFEEAKRRHWCHVWNQSGRDQSRHAARVEDLRFFAAIPYPHEFTGDGWSDWERYQRPASDGRGWVAICPGERGNNYYTADPVTVEILRRRYLRALNR